MTDARYVIARAIRNMPEDDIDGPTHDEYADAVIAALAAAGLSITATPDTDDTVPKQVLRDLADEWVRPRRNVRIMEDGYASVFILGAQEYAAELRAAIGDVTDV